VCAERDLALEPWLYGDIDARASEVLVRLGLSEGKRFAVFSVMGNAAQEHRKSIFEYAKKLGREGVTPIFAVMYPAQDLALSRKLCKDLGGILAYPFGATGIVALMRGAEVVCSMRYHALVLAHVAGASFVGIGDDQKIKSFCSEYGGEYINTSAEGII
jgi:polysaccharide pyruvyl transferase WcaK-like protein